MDFSSARLLSVNVGLPRTVQSGKLSVATAIWKSPVRGRVAVRATNIDGDRQADLSVHGGPEKAVYVYAQEDIDWWERELDRALDFGAFGENLTTVGLDVTAAILGQRWAIGSAVFEVVQPRVPCYKLGVRFDDRSVPRRFAAAGRPGAYLRVVTEGDIAADDAIVVLGSAQHNISVGMVARAYHSHDRDLAAQILEAPELISSWRDWAQQRVDT